MPEQPIPPDIFERVMQFLQARRTGNIILNVKEGIITGAQLHEFLKARVE